MSKRVSLILGDMDVQWIAPFILEGTDEYNVLREWATRHGNEPVKSEASALRALLRVAVTALHDDVLDSGYADLAKTYNGEPAAAERRAARDRYASRTDANL